MGRYHCLPALAAFLLPAAPLGAQARQGFQAAWQDVAKVFRTGCERSNIAGASLMFLHGGNVIAREFYGFADLATRRRIDENTIYHWASITKTFTGIAIMQLRDRGLLRLSDPILDYVPELGRVHNPFGSMRKITIRHLLSHSAGFRRPTWPWGGDKKWHPHEPTSWSQLVAMMPYSEIAFEPGSKYGYSNPGVVFLGRVIEKLSGDDYEVYVDKNILKPLRMYHSYFDHTPRHLLKHRSNNYRCTSGGLEANGLDFDTGITVSNGGLNAPLTDMAKYLAFLSGDVDPDSEAATVLQRSSLEEMWRPQLEVAGAGEQTERTSIGLTFFVTVRGEDRFIGHTGGQKAFTSFFYLHPASRTAAIGAFNTSSAGPLMTKLRRSLMQRVTPRFTPGVRRDTYVPPKDVHWVRNSAEYRAIAYQTFAVATWRINRLVAGMERSKWAVAVDADETILDNSRYQVERARSGLGFTSKSWNAWCRRREAEAVPGAVAFLRHVRQLGGKIAIVSNRSRVVQEDTEENLRRLGVPFDVVLLRDEEREKEPRWERIRRGTASPDLGPLEIVLWMGDNIRDFPQLTQDHGFAQPPDHRWGESWLMLPNPMYGSWESLPPRR